MSKIQTGSQTVGPFFKYGLAWPNGERLFEAGAHGPPVRICGTIRDGAGEPVPDAFLEIWQPDPQGRFGKPRSGGCDGFGRVPTDEQGRFEFETRIPGAVPGAGGSMQAPHLTVTVFARGLLQHLFTRIYFAGRTGHQAVEDAADDGPEDGRDGGRDSYDAVLAAAGERAATLIARRIAEDRYQWDVVLQGPAETVFLQF